MTEDQAKAITELATKILHPKMLGTALSLRLHPPNEYNERWQIRFTIDYSGSVELVDRRPGQTYTDFLSNRLQELESMVDGMRERMGQFAEGKGPI